MELQKYLLETFVKYKPKMQVLTCSPLFSKKADQESFGFTSLYFLMLHFWSLYIKTGVNEICQEIKVHLFRKKNISSLRVNKAILDVHSKIISLPQIDFQNVNIFTKMLFLYHLTGSIMTVTF